MIFLILGPNGSGKSACAEKLAAGLSAKLRARTSSAPSASSAGALYYIATMIPHGEDGRTKVENHRKQRRPFAFITVEKSGAVSGIPLPPDAVVLLEDVSNLLGSALFDGSREGNENEVFADIAALCAKCRAAVLVSIGGLVPGPEYDGETRAYIDALNRLNERLADFADTVLTMRGGMPVLLKGAAVCALD